MILSNTETVPGKTIVGHYASVRAREAEHRGFPVLKEMLAFGTALKLARE